MATKHFCDCCKQESTNRIKQIEVPVHIQSPGGYVDLKSGEEVSGRNITYDLCQSCFNKTMKISYSAMISLGLTVKDV